ncbi:MAG: carboxypeptidase M32 [Acholeplasmataceae bacterium]|nr:carboxypeptidase M32 [Acholeplasmataceae bacterium]
MEQIQQFRDLVKKQKAYAYMMALVSWDSQTEAPRDAFSRRAEVMGYMSGEIFKLMVAKENVELIYALDAKKDELDDLTAREIKRAKKQIDKIIKIPQAEFVEYQSLLQMAQVNWEEAKAKADYSLFKDTLQKIFDFNRRFVSYYGIDDDPYNVMLDEFEEGMSMKEYDQFFDTLKKDLVPFVRKVLEKTKNQKNADFVFRHYSESKQKEFSEYLLDVMKFNRNRGLLKKSVHPFTWNTSPADVRLTTRYLENYALSCIFSVIHELGHAIYEQQIDTKWDDTFLSNGASMGIHESQSRFYENILGRSLAFWETHYRKFQEIFPEQTKGISVKEFHKAVNHVEATLIRIEADELTYPLHIMVRYEIEKLLMQDKVSIDELPTLWNRTIKEYLGIEPKNDTEGVLQDIHWSGGMIGYFPTYALGSAYAAQIYNVMKKEIDIDKAIRDNKMELINFWLKEKMHQYGSSKTPKELLVSITGEEFNPRYYINYLKEKYTELYL